MAKATDQQVQSYVNERIRPWSELIRTASLQANDIEATFGDIYENLIDPNVTWKDTRADAPPHLLTPADVLNIHVALNNFRTWQQGEAQWPVIIDACVRPVEG